MASILESVSETISTSEVGEEVEFVDTIDIDNHPSLRFGHSSDVFRKLVYMFGGNDGALCSNSMFIFSMEHGRWDGEYYHDDNISERFSHASCLLGDRIFIHGGRTGEGGKVLNDIFFFNTRSKTFTTIQPANESPFLFSHRMESVGSNLFFIGGKDERMRFSRCLYSFHTGTRMFKQIEVVSTEDLPLPLISQHFSVSEATADIKTAYVIGGVIPNQEEEEEEEGENESLSLSLSEIPRTSVITRLTLDSDDEDVVVLEEAKNSGKNQVFPISLYLIKTLLTTQIFCIGTEPGKNHPNLFCLRESDETFRWERKNVKGMENYLDMFRPKHSSHYFRDRIFIFGGESFRRSKGMKLDSNINYLMLMDDMPPDAIHYILRFLQFRDILTICQTSKNWGVSLASKMDNIWEPFYNLEFKTGRFCADKELGEELETKNSYYEKFIVLKKHLNLFSFARFRYVGPEIRFNKIESTYARYLKRRRKRINMSCCLIGDSKVGKRSLIDRLKKGDEYDPEFTSSIGELENYQLKLGQFEVRINFRDGSAYHQYDRLRGLFYQGFHVFLACFDVTNDKSFENIETKWIDDVLQHEHDNLPVIVLVGTKMDKEEERSISYETAVEFARKREEVLFYVETSAFRDWNINRAKVFAKLVFAAHMTDLFSKKGGKDHDDCKVM